jgi:hypothetical protein
MKKSLLRLFVLVLIATLAACGGGGGGSEGEAGVLVLPAGVAVSSIAPSQVYPGDTVTISGSGLDKVTTVVVGGGVATITAQSASSLQFSVPSAADGSVVLWFANGATLTPSQALAIHQTPTISGFSPASGIVGTSVTITGTHLSEVGKVLFNATEAAPESVTDRSLVVRVPEGASTGLISVISGSRQSGGIGPFSVAPTIKVSAYSPASGAAGTYVTVTGSGIEAVTSVMVGSASVAIESRSATQLSFAVPNGGTIQLLGTGGQSVPVGSFTLDSSMVPAVAVERIDVAQTYSQVVNSTYQRLSPGKSALVRAYVTSQARIASPLVQLVASNGGTTLGTLTLSGPVSLPRTAQQANLSQSFSATLPASWISPGLNLSVKVANTAPANSGATLSVTPRVGSPVKDTIVIVPLIVAKGTSTLTARTPDLAAVRTMLTRMYPFIDANVGVSVRTPYDISSIVDQGRLFSATDSVQDNEWSTALEALESLREQEGGTKHYYGLLPGTGFRSGTAGLGYMNNLNTDYLSALGFDSSMTFWLTTMTHEIGHNYSLAHANCGGVTSYDTANPHTDGSLGDTMIWDNAAHALVDPAGKYDVMGYCDGEWLSDYNYSKAQAYQESGATKAAAVYTTAQAMVEFSGSIAADGSVTLRPALARIETRRPVGTGEHTLRLKTRDGHIIDEAFTAVPVMDGRGAMAHFRVMLKSPGTISSVEVLKHGRSLPTTLAMPGRVRAAASSGREGVEEPSVQWSESAGDLKLTWNATAWPLLQVRYRKGSSTVVLAGNLSGGSASVSTRGLASGGRFEFSLSQGLNARVIEAAR